MKQALVRQRLPGAPGSAFLPGCRPYGRGISSCLQMARTVPSLISRWRGTLAILCKLGLNQILWAPAGGPSLRVGFARVGRGACGTGAAFLFAYAGIFA